jgi:hypothetical protein
MADLLADIPEWKQAYMRDLTTSIDIEKILLAAALLNGTLIVVADGSAPSAGGFTWVLAAYEDPLHLIHGDGPLTIRHHITPHGSLRLPLEEISLSTY